MLLPAINKRAECTLKSSRADTLSCAWLFFHWCLLSLQKKKPKNALLLLPKVRKRSCLHHSVCDRIDARFQTQERGEQTQRSGKGGSRTAVSLKDAPSSWVLSALASELWRRVWTGDWSLQHIAVQRNRKTCCLCCSQNFQVIDFQVRAAIFPKLKSFLEEQALKSSTALYWAYLEGIQHRWGTNVSAKPCLPCSCVFTSPFDQSLCYSTWPLFWACLSLLSPGPGLHLYFWHLPHLTLLCFPLRRRKAALLRYQHLGSLLQPFILPR